MPSLSLTLLSLLAPLSTALQVHAAGPNALRAAHTSSTTARVVSPSLTISDSAEIAEAEVAADLCANCDVVDMLMGSPLARVPPFKKVMAANRAEIAQRIMRAATELNMQTVGIYGYEDRYSQHRWGADQSFVLEKRDPADSPISAYLDAEQIVRIAIEQGVDAIHPGYGFLSESPEFAQLCEDKGVTFVGPTVDNLKTFADKTTARVAAIKANVPVVPGTDEAVTNVADAVAFCEEYGLPVIIKAAMGGGGKGMRVVRSMDTLPALFETASSEAKSAFGDGSVFLERFIESPRHIEVQIIGDGKGNVVHLWERDCSVQRRHQKVVEIAPAWNLPPQLRATLHADSKRLMGDAQYKNAGTVEFLVDQQGRHYFIEVNPRIQVEHTVTEEVTGIDVVQAQMRIAGGASLEDVGLVQQNIHARGIALQCRVTTENPERNFQPDTGVLSVYRHSAGFGMRHDGIGYSGMTVTPFYDSLLVKYTARGSNWEEVVRRMRRALQEARIRGVQTNIPFLLNVLTHPEFEGGVVTTGFIDEHPELLTVSGQKWEFASPTQADERLVYRVEKLMRYLANLAVNGHPPELGADAAKLSKTHKPLTPPQLPAEESASPPPEGWRSVLLEKGPEGFAKAVREHKGLLLTDTTWRDAHQSLLATRMRTAELLTAAPATARVLPNLFSTEMWGGATFDVSMRFLHECPWERLEALRERVPNVPFQMLLRGANAVGYTNYPDNLVHAFCKQAKESGIDIFRVFDSLNYLDNLKLGVEAAGGAGGFVEGAICYTGDVADPKRGKYTLDYYLEYARELAALGVHSIAIKDMAGLLTPRAARMLIGGIRAELPSMPIHVHTHDTSGGSIASMLAAAEAGADIVDAAIDGMSGLTSQPSLGALIAALRDSELDTGYELGKLEPLNNYWERARRLYLPFESGQLSGSSDVYQHEIPGGQYTNLLFQATQLGLEDKWSEIKRKYAQANVLLGDIPKVTPSSKVVGDLAQFMVAQKLEPEALVAQAESLAFPDSVVQYFQGAIGQPPGGFPEPLRSRIIKGRTLDNGKEFYEGRPGEELPPFDFKAAEAALKEKYGSSGLKDVLSYALYPKVYADWQAFQGLFGDVGHLPTHLFLNPMKEGDEVELELDSGRAFLLKLVSIPTADDDGIRKVIMEVNGERWFLPVKDASLVTKGTSKEKASPSDAGAVGAPMPGVVVGVKVKVGDVISEGEPLVVLSAMKMETQIPAPKAGTVTRMLCVEGDKVEPDDLLLVVE
eukprot:CAMPEP_0119373062 /NCGR_PEP_ID=MMETSP1334-20130426/23605_1 /TAXON_ID=127549 /ORGANISM="Calcidiscus leptoporus, Strain RCC1130" /LENGTH=1251 /DNA_ID=CAMNT_0007390719 /DNA_START=133 /DNA_END=3888 /DNA_ORIENTATION=+